MGVFDQVHRIGEGDRERDAAKHAKPRKLAEGTFNFWNCVYVFRGNGGQKLLGCCSWNYGTMGPDQSENFETALVCLPHLAPTAASDFQLNS